MIPNPQPASLVWGSQASSAPPQRYPGSGPRSNANSTTCRHHPRHWTLKHLLAVMSQNDIFVFCLFVWILGAQRLCLLYFYCLEACSAYFSERIDKWRYRWTLSEGLPLRSFSATLLTCADSYPPSPSLRIYSAPSLCNWHGLTSPFICSSQLYIKRCLVITLRLIL